MNSCHGLQGSHVQEFGVKSIEQEVAGDFQGAGDELPNNLHAPASPSHHSTTHRTQHDADLVHLELAVDAAVTPEEGSAAAAALEAERSARASLDRSVRRAVDALVRQYPEQLGRDVRDGEVGAHRLASSLHDCSGMLRLLHVASAPVLPRGAAVKTALAHSSAVCLSFHTSRACV
jgi:hypothetical protein